MPSGTLGTIFAVLSYTGAAIYCFVLPGYALTFLFQSRRTLSWLEQIAVASAISVALYPLLYLWAYTLGIQAGALIAWTPGAAGLAVWIWAHRTWVYSKRPTAVQLFNAKYDIALLVLISILIISRLFPVRGMVAPAWGDSIHHTMITQLIVDHGGLFQSWAPYAPIETFSYHFGFHTNMAVWATVTGKAVPHAIITGAQMLNVLAVLALYPLAVRLGGSQIAGIGALIIAGLISQLPGMYVNWGRYTQLTAQIMLPVWIWALDVWWTEPRRPPSRFLGMIALLAAGIALTHYRVAIVALFAAVAWGMWALWLLRTDWRAWLQRTIGLAGAGVISAVLVLPWVFVVRASRLVDVANDLATRNTDAPAVRGELAVWNSTESYYPTTLWAVSLAAWVCALWRRRPLAIPLLIWSALAFIAASPFLVRAAGTGIVTNFVLVLGLYIPISLLVGWLLSEIWRAARIRRFGEPIWATAMVLLTLLGFSRQLAIVDPFYQMVTPEDIRALAWVDENVPPDSRFLVNAFLAYNDSLVVGSDAGWWLPYYTRQTNNVPAILYGVESVSPDIDRKGLLQLVLDVQASQGAPDALHAALCQYAVTHVYLGARQGEAGFGETQLLKPVWFEHNPDFRLLYEAGNAQVWRFDRSGCLAP